jgi:hypothetical protein
VVATAQALSPTFFVRPWADTLVDRVGVDPRSAYAERFWLGIVGPTSTWLLRYVAARLEAEPAGFDLDLAETSRSLGVAARSGRNAPIVRTLERCAQFGLARFDGDDRTVVYVRRKLPPLSRYQVQRLPADLQDAHERWLGAHGPAAQAQHAQIRARRLALSLLELGEDLESAERHLSRWRYPPEVGREAAAWAWERHRAALAAANAEATLTP